DGSRSTWILEAERSVLIVVSESFGVAAPADDRAQRLLGLLLVHVVLELIQEAALAGAMTRALIEHAADVGRERHVIEELPGKDSLALIELGIGERKSHVRQLDVAARQLREAHHLRGLGDREEL